ncbi:unnamed protein product [Didymodactylos carnosus]|uniref:Uncharacterized protein n=1 Tax=Didymodactylos carnosus TaxID=1234261 RepID=A0A814FRB5_9BILA|nr:unnamed protein product [Didymodactylos carnosus]CAF0986235.1 unnamed protein product [Didymodactylos carnosus]CAF3669998.1 unnamed protein product [Didymodactylos carnosus]CAF3758511.1 unnamed protein product [Didymodactylos carnosus]
MARLFIFIALLALTPHATGFFWDWFRPSHPTEIVNSGSTNACDYTITIKGHNAHYVVCGNRTGTAKLSDSVKNQIAQAVKAAEPLDKLPTRPCPKSASFGTTTVVKHKGKATGDISCASTDQVNKLFNATETVVQQLHLNLVKHIITLPL